MKECSPSVDGARPQTRVALGDIKIFEGQDEEDEKEDELGGMSAEERKQRDAEKLVQEEERLKKVLWEKRFKLYCLNASVVGLRYVNDESWF